MAGIFDLFRPTDPQADNPGLVARISKWFVREQTQPAEKGQTSEAGTSATASPSIEQYELWQLRYDRRSIIADIRKLYLDEPRFARAVKKVGREAVRKGVVVSIKTSAKRGPAAGRNRRALEILERTLKECNLTPAKLRSWATALPLEGDLFVQRVVQGNRVVDAKRMPSASMERNTDSQDRFFDPTRAFSQLDIQTDQTIADFALWQIHHERWNHMDGERYGTSEFIQLRRPSRNLQLMEQAQVIRRITRAALRLLHKVGTKENPGNEKDVEEYKKRNNLAAVSKGGFDPAIATKDFFGNGLTEVIAIPGDPNLEKIEDLEYFQDVFAVGTGAPKAMLGWSSKDINRDILEDQIKQWLNEVQDVTDAIANVVRGILDFALLLEGIDPATVEYDLKFSKNTLESASERLDRVTKARQNTLGSGKNAIADPLIPRRIAVTEISEDFDFHDVDAIIEELEQERVLREAQVSEDDDGGDPAQDEPARKEKQRAEPKPAAERG